MRATGNYLRTSKGVAVSGHEGVVRDEVSISAIRSAVTVARMVERTTKLSETGQMQICVTMQFSESR
jgi:hypothetical protein